MIELKLLYHKFKKDLYYWSMGKLERLVKPPKTIEELVYQDILNSFVYGQQTIYKLGIKSNSLEDTDLKFMIQEYTNNYEDISDEDLVYIYNKIVKYLNKKFRFSTNLHIIDYDDNYFEVHWIQVNLF